MQAIHTPSRRANDGWGIDLLLLTLLFGILFFTLLGDRPLFTPDEGRYAEIAREMAVSGDFTTPTLNDIKYFEKPPLFYWLSAVAIQAGGANILAVRSINAILALLGCLLTYATGRLLYGRAAGLIASLVLSTSTLYFVMAHMVSLDLPVTVFIAASLYGFILAVRTSRLRIRKPYFILAAIAASLAVLTKGLIGIVFPCMIVAVWLTVVGDWRQLKRLPLIAATVVFILITAPWHILVDYVNPEFFNFYFIEQHFLRYTTLDVGHYQPAWFFIPTLLAGFFPWVVFLPQTLAASFPCRWKQRHEYGTELFFVLWALLIFVFFSFSKSKLIPYLLPVIPPLAILTGRYLAAHLQTATRGIWLGCLSLVLLASIMSYYLWNLSIPLAHPAAAILSLRISVISLLLGSLLGAWLLYRSPRLMLGMTFTGAALFLILSLGAVRFIDTRTVQPLAQILKPLLQPGDEVLTYNQYYQDLPFYLEQRVSILNWRNELTFGMAHQNTQAWMIDDAEFWKRWRSKQRVYMIISKDEYQHFHQRYPHERIITISETATNMLVTNLPLVIPPS